MGKNSLKTRPPVVSIGTRPLAPPMRALIERAYTVFGTYQLDPPLDVCGRCCVTSEEHDRLVKTPLRDISSHLLSQFTDTAQSSQPSLNQFKVFLPRYLELIACDDAPSHSLELALHRFAPFTAADFSSAENQVIDDFAAAIFTQVLRQEYGKRWYDGPVSYLAMWLKTGRDPAPLWAAWQRSSHVDALLHLADMLVHDVGTVAAPPRFTNPFVDEAGSRTVIAWLSKAETKAVFNPIFEALLLEGEGLDPDQAEMVSWAYEVLNPSDG